jgi:hypothetical protein
MGPKIDVFVAFERSMRDYIHQAPVPGSIDFTSTPAEPMKSHG